MKTLYINGDSHSAGAETVKNYCFAEDDPQYQHLGRKPHPDCLDKSYGKKLADMLERDLVCEAESASSNQRILRTTKEYIKGCENTSNLFVVIGWTTWERVEWYIDGEYYQLTASGTDDVPEGYKETYKEWVADRTPHQHAMARGHWHYQIYQYHKHLRSHNIKHLFFNTFSCLEGDLDWEGRYFYPYDKQHTMYHYLLNSLYLPNKNYHFGEAAHREWANVLFDKARFLV